MNAPLMKHNPAFLTPEQLRSSFVVRKRDLDIVLQYICDSTGPSNQHVLVLGSRGMGKTTLVRMLADTVTRDPELGARWYPLLFGEESYTVSSIGELWLEAIMHLGDQTGDAQWQALHDELRAERDDDRLCARALARLVGFAEEQGKRILLIVENLHMLLDEQMSKKDAWSLRHTLQNEPRILLLATATSRFGAIVDEDQALYEMFATYALEPLDLAECRALWEAVGGVEASERRVRPMQILTGGNPRLLGILASFAAKTSLRHLMENLTQLVDDNTDYFKSHLESLPATERKVYVMLADLWAPSTAREVAEAARMEVNQASALLHRLVGRGAVVEEGQGRRLRYRLSERLYNIYHLLRRRGAGAARVRAVVDFMIHLYEGDGLVGLLGRIAEEAKELGPENRRDHFDVMEGILRRVRDSKLRSIIVESLVFRLDVLSWPDVSASLSVALERLLRRENKQFMKEVDLRANELGLAKEAIALMELKRYGDAGAVLERMADIEVSRRVDGVPSAEASIDAYLVAERPHDAERCVRRWLASMAKDPKLAEQLVRVLGCLDPEEQTRLLREYEQMAAAGERWAWVAVAVARLFQKDWSGIIQAFDEARCHRIANPFISAMAWVGAMTSQSGVEITTWQHERQRELVPAFPWAGRMLAASKDPMARISGALLLGALSGLWDEAFPVVEQILTSEEDTRKAAGNLCVLLIEAAAAGQVDRALTLLEGSPVRPSFELFIVAFRQIARQPVHAPPEVLEVVSDLVRLIDQRRGEREKESAKEAHAAPGRPNPKDVSKRRRAGKGRAGAEN
ncbi:AAA family ATPase [Sorangium sp. So ce1000]|uniref:AAA family ATPase n=1 Tax=Sorangium sp. So ce1000 TaxID=3133325 RepID=UPI003F61461C